MTEPNPSPIVSTLAGPIAALLAESFAILASRLPDAYARMTALLHGCEAELVLDGESIDLRFGPAPARSSRPLPRIECSLATVLAVLDARLTLAEAVEIDALRVRSDLDRLVLLHDGLLAYVHGAVRCPGFPELLVRLRLQALAPSESTPHE